jgi:hypothetical protein
MPRTPPRVTLRFTRVLRAIVVGQMQAFAFGHMRWPNAAHPLTSPIRFVRGGAQRLLSECEPLAFGQGRRPSEVAESSGLGHLGWAAALAECEPLAFEQQPLRAPPNNLYGACEGMRRIWPSHVSKCKCSHLTNNNCAPPPSKT